MFSLLSYMSQTFQLILSQTAIISKQKFLSLDDWDNKSCFDGTYKNFFEYPLLGFNFYLLTNPLKCSITAAKKDYMFFFSFFIWK